ncbi:LOW QUALITY PROTEIN: palmitoyltransferase ZDHHC6-like [Thomomys bottae]
MDKSEEDPISADSAVTAATKNKDFQKIDKQNAVQKPTKETILQDSNSRRYLRRQVHRDITVDGRFQGLGEEKQSLHTQWPQKRDGRGAGTKDWTEENSQDSMSLQHCKVCKAPRSHPCRKCNRCVMKMDHHCPWIDNCCGYQNHASFTLFLLLVPLGCVHAAFIFVMTMYTQLYDRLSFGWSTVKTDRSAARRDPLPIVPFGLAAFALGLALGTTIAIGMLCFSQRKIILRNKTSIESWIEEKLKDQIQYYQLDETFVFPYDMGSRWKNFKQVFTWSGVPEGDGLEWQIRGCHQYSLTIEQLKQKADKRVRSVRYKAIENYSGAYGPLNRGIKTFFTSPCTEEPQIQLQKGEFILTTRGL